MNPIRRTLTAVVLAAGLSLAIGGCNHDPDRDPGVCVVLPGNLPAFCY